MEFVSIDCLILYGHYDRNVQRLKVAQAAQLTAPRADPVVQGVKFRCLSLCGVLTLTQQ